MNDQVVTVGTMSVGIQGGNSAFEEVSTKRPGLSWSLRGREVLGRHRKATYSPDGDHRKVIQIRASASDRRFSHVILIPRYRLILEIGE